MRGVYGVRGGGSHLRALEGGALARAHHAAQQLRTHQLRAPRQVPSLRPPTLSAAAAAASAAAAAAAAATAAPAASATRRALGHLARQLAQLRPASCVGGGELRQGCCGLGLGRRRIEPPTERVGGLRLPPQGPPLARRLPHRRAPLPRRRRGRRRGRRRAAGGRADGRRRAMRSFAQRRAALGNSGVTPTPANRGGAAAASGTAAAASGTAAAVGTRSKGDG